VREREAATEFDRKIVRWI